MGPWGWSFVAAFTGGAILAFAKQLTPLWVGRSGSIGPCRRRDDGAQRSLMLVPFAP
jgi:hypothetical protein